MRGPRSAHRARSIAGSALAAALLSACVRPADGTCTTSGDCRASEVCVDEVCRKACNSDYECSGGERCFDGACMPRAPADAAAVDTQAPDVPGADRDRPDVTGVDLRVDAGPTDHLAADRDAAMDAGAEAGSDAGHDAGRDAGIDAGRIDVGVGGDSGGADAAGDAGPVCPGELASCGGACVDLLADPDHCGACDRSAIVLYNDGSNSPVPLTSHCLGGQPACGQQIGPCDDQVCYSSSVPSAATCVDCTEAYTDFCSNGSACCDSQCMEPTQFDAVCGCHPAGMTPISDCTSFNLETSTGYGGRICVDGAGQAVTAATLSDGHCGCAASGVAHCGSTEYDNQGIGTSITLVGLCDPDTATCIPQSASACGLVQGVVSHEGMRYPGSQCAPDLGGLLCEDNLGSDGLGECGCGSASAVDPNELCQLPVPGSDGLPHVVAQHCGVSGFCQCPHEGQPCDPGAATPDCCATGCTDLASDMNNCGQCEVACLLLPECGTSMGLAPGQCPCVNHESCPDSGGGGGTACMGDGCVCPAFGNEPCPLQSWCCNGDYLFGQAQGCCLETCGSTSNTCLRPAGCGGTAGSITCTSAGNFWCCAAGQLCGTVPAECL